MDQDRFTSDGQLEGVSIIRGNCPNLTAKLRTFAYNYPLFAVGFPDTLNKNRLEMLEEPYVVGAIPDGIIYILHINQQGDFYLRNHYNQTFTVDDNHKIQFPGADGKCLKDSVFIGFLVELIAKDDREVKKQRYMYMIQDVTRCNGKDISSMGILARMAHLESDVMAPRRRALAAGSISTDKECLEIAVVAYKEVSQTEEFIHQGQYVSHSDHYNYFIRSLYFVPKNQRYLWGSPISNFLRWDFALKARCCFRLFLDGREKIGSLFMRHPGGSDEIYFAPIDLTEDMLDLDGCTIECKYVGRNWIFVERSDRKFPHLLSAALGKMERMENSVSAEDILSLLHLS